MSRVDEAMRRAAEQASKNGTGEAQPLEGLDTEFADATELSREAYPIEMPERRRPKPTPFPSAVPELPKADVSVEVASPRASIFDRLDPRLAQKTVADWRVAPVSREQYRRLAATLHHANAADGVKVVMLASAVPGEGKTLTASNLAMTFSESYRRNVLLIDADLRKPTLHTVFALDNSSGLGDGLAAVDERKLPVRQVSPRLAVLTAGVPTGDPMAGLTSERMRRLIDEARDTFDWVIIDTPPVAFLPDANLLAAMVDVAILVVKAGSTDFNVVQRAIEAIGRDRIIGVVLNRADAPAHASDYDYYGGYYEPSAEVSEGP